MHPTDDAADTDRDRIYRRAGLGARVGYGRSPALLLVDLQRAETDPASPLGWDASGLIRTVNELTAAARESGLPVVWLRVVFREPAAESAGTWGLKIPGLRSVLDGTPGAELDERLVVDRERDVFIERQRADCFHGTGLDELLRGRGVDTVVLCGCTTSGCVRTAADAALTRDYRVIVPAEGVGDRLPESHRVHLEDIGSKIGDVRPAAEVREYLAGCRDRPEPRPGPAG